jgi:Protein of unknown function (DUF1161)
MKTWIALFVALASTGASAQARKPCDELKAEIAKKIESHNLVSYSLQVVDKGKEGDSDGKIVGSCDGGTKSVVYRRTETPAPTMQAKAADTTKQQ